MEKDVGEHAVGILELGKPRTFGSGNGKQGKREGNDWTLPEPQASKVEQRGEIRNFRLLDSASLSFGHSN